MQHATTTYLVIKQLAGHLPPHLDPLQQIIADHIDLVTNLWISVWWMTAFVLLYHLWQEYKEQKNDKQGR